MNVANGSIKQSERVLALVDFLHFLLSDTKTVIGRSSGDQLPVTNPHDYNSKSKTCELTRQYLAVGIVTLGAFASGATLSWSSAAVPLLYENNFITKLQRSWVTSILCLGAFFGAVPAGLISEYFGRKKTLLSLALTMLVSWILVVSSPNVWGLYVGRFVAGIATGAVSVTVPAYVADIAEPKLKAKFANFYQIQLVGGILFGFITGMAHSVTILSIMSASLPLLYFVAFVFMPESPVYLMSQGKTSEARIALQYFRGTICDVEQELLDIKANICNSPKNKENFRDLVNDRATFKALIVSFGLMCFQQLIGINVIIFYATELFDKCNLSISKPEAAIILGSAHVFSTYFSILLLFRYSRRRLLIFSFIIMSISLFATGVYFVLKGSGFNLHSWMPVVCLCIYLCAYSCGVGPIPWLILHQIFPANVTRRATAFSAGFSWFLAFGVTKVFHNMCAAIGLGWVILNFGVVCLIGALFVYFGVPETKDTTLEEIQKELKGIRTRRRHRHIIEIESVSEI